MKLLNHFPRLMGKENRMVFSKDEMIETFTEWMKVGKSCEVGLYAFEEWENNEPNTETVIIDIIMFHGKEERLRELGESFGKRGFKGYLIFDGKETFLLVEYEMPLTMTLPEFPDIRVEQNLRKKIIWPNTINGKTGERSKVVEKFES